MLAPKRILVPTDFTEDSDRALREAVDIAKTSNAKVFLLHVDANLPVSSAEFVPSEQMIRAVEKQEERDAKAKMFEEIMKVAREADVEIEVEERHGPTRDEILNYGQEKGVDLIIIEPHTRKGLKTFLGGITDQLIKEATCPLLVLPIIH